MGAGKFCLRAIQGKGDVHVPQRSVDIFGNAVWSRKRSQHVPTCQLYHIDDCQVVIYISIPRRCHHLHEVCGRGSGAPADSDGTIIESWWVIETEEMLLPCGWYRLLGSPNPSLQTWYVSESDNCDSWTTTSYKRDWTWVIPRSIHCTLTDCNAFCNHILPVEWQV